MALHRPRTGFSTSTIGRKIPHMPAPLRLDSNHTDLRISLRKVRKKFERTETISEHEAAKPKCPKCGSKKVSFVPGNVYVVTPRRAEHTNRYPGPFLDFRPVGQSH
jgi:hypothetical protein